MAQCKAITDPNTQWPPFCPSIAASYLYAVLFALTFIAHIVQMFWTRKWYSWVVCTSAALQVATYILRTLSIQQPATEIYYTLWFILMLVSDLSQLSLSHRSP